MSEGLTGSIGSPLLDAAFEAEADRLTGTRVRDGNTIALLAKGEESFAKRWELVGSARRSVHLVSFSVIRDETSRRLAEVVKEKVREGVEVKMICDDLALYTTFARGILEDMAKAGAEIVTYNPPLRWLGIDAFRGHPFQQLMRRARRQLKRRFHEKYLVVDGSQAILGGMNWGTKYALGGSEPHAWRDTDSYITGPVVADIQRGFLRSLFFYRAMEEEWRRRRERGFDSKAVYEEAREREARFMQESAGAYFPELRPTGDARIRYVGHKPYDEGTLPLTNAFLQAVRTARRSIWWGCHGIRPPRMLAENLADAAARGVDVHVITNSKRSSRTLMGRGMLGWMYWECSNHFRWLLERGIHVHLWQLPGAFHSKNLVVDDEVAAVGSYNAANGSTFHHTESAVFVYGGDFPDRVRRQFSADLEDCRELTLAEARRVPGWADPFRRVLHERNLLVDRAVWPEALRADLDASRYKWKFTDPPS